MSSSSSSPPPPLPQLKIARVPFGPLCTFDKLNEELGKVGCVVVTNVLLSAQVDEARSLLWDWLEKVAPGVDRNDAKKWTNDIRPPHMGGLIQHFGVGWNPASIYVREAVKPVFDRVWGSDDLWTSFDGISVTFNSPALQKQPKEWKLHVDQTDTDFKCVQGGVALSRQKEDEHCFVCVPGSHLLLPRLLAQVAPPKSAHWMTLDLVQVQILKNEGLRLERVALEPGDLVLWDSRTAHMANSGYLPGSDPEARREHVFVCMGPPPANPKVRATEVKKRRKCCEESRTSMHSFERIRVFGKEPSTWGREEKRAKMHPQPPVEMTQQQKKMHGLVV